MGRSIGYRYDIYLFYRTADLTNLPQEHLDLGNGLVNCKCNLGLTIQPSDFVHSLLGEATDHIVSPLPWSRVRY